VIGNYKPNRILQRRVIKQVQSLCGTPRQRYCPAGSEENTSPRGRLNGIVVNKEDIGSHSKDQSFYFLILVMQEQRKGLP
jgi:hypothetical protein